MKDKHPRSEANPPPKKTDQESEWFLPSAGGPGVATQAGSGRSMLMTADKQGFAELNRLEIRRGRWFQLSLETPFLSQEKAATYMSVS